MTTTFDAPAGAAAPVGDELALAHRARRRDRQRIIKVNVARLVVLVVFIGGWQLLTTVKVIDPFFFGQPSGIAIALKNLFVHGTAYGSIWSQIGVTMKEALLGFIYGVVGGIVVGITLGQSRFLADVAGPFIKVANAIPRIVLGSIFIVAFGLGTTSKVLLASVLVFFVVFFNAFQGVREVDRNLINNVRVLGGSRLHLNRHVILPSALTWITASLHVAFGFALIGAIVGEYLGAQSGLGLVISTAQNHFDPDTVFATMAIIAVITLAAEYLISVGEHRMLSWRPPSGADSAAGF